MTEKKYKVGMYGGKFCPMHLRHRFVLERAMRECEELHVFMFYNTPEETESRSKWFTDPRFRLSQVYRCVRDISDSNADCDCECTIHAISSKKYTIDGTEDWYAEAARIKQDAGEINAVYSSEQSYDEFFKTAYPNAEHVIVDPDRTNYNIHSSDLRPMDDTNQELYRWLA